MGVNTQGGVLAFDWQVVEQVRPEIDNFAPAWANVVAGIEVPRLVIAGGATSPVPQEQIADLVHHLPDGHMVNIEAGTSRTRANHRSSPRDS